MRRSLSVRIATLVLVALMSAPAFAAPRQDDPISGIERAISRIIKQIKNLIPMDFDSLGAPKP